MSNPKSATPAEFEKALADLPDPVQAVVLDAGVQNRAIESAVLAEWKKRLGWSLEDAMRALLPFAAASAHAPISGLKVGAVAACTRAGAPSDPVLYLGANLEFLGGTLADSVHAEQTAVVRGWLDGASTLASIATNAAPCGHCRQFLTEVRCGAGDVSLITPTGQIRLSESLPDAFGPEALGAAWRVFDDHPVPVTLASSLDATELQARALEAARRSHVSYSGCPAGVALRLASGRIVVGCALESVAFNPSLSPMQCALAQLHGPTRSSDPIVEACLGEASGPVSHASRDARLLACVAPTVELQVLSLRSG